jgi:hypothetical protein
LIARFEDQTLVFSDHGFFSKDGNPINLKVCDRNEHNERMIIETVLSRLTTICHFKKVSHRLWAYFKARLAFTMTASNLLVQWHGIYPDPDGSVHLSIAEFNL